MSKQMFLGQVSTDFSTCGLPLFSRKPRRLKKQNRKRREKLMKTAGTLKLPGGSVVEVHDLTELAASLRSESGGSWADQTGGEWPSMIIVHPPCEHPPCEPFAKRDKVIDVEAEIVGPKLIAFPTPSRS